MVLYESFTIISRGFGQQGAGRKEGKALDLSVTDIPTVVHCHEISHEKERVRQHAHSNLKAQKTGSLSNVNHVKKASSSSCMLSKVIFIFGYKVQTSLFPQTMSSHPRDVRKRRDDMAVAYVPPSQILCSSGSPMPG